MRYEIPDLLDIRGSYTYSHVTHDLARLMPILAGRCGGSWLERDLESTFQAQSTVIDHAWRRFVRECYRPIAAKIKAESHRGNSGLFGRTTLRSYVMAGRIMFTFARAPERQSDDPHENAMYMAAKRFGKFADGRPFIERAEQSISFVGDDSDMTGCRSGMNYPNTPYAECVAMINDVTDNWKPDQFVEDRRVSLG
jgi:hypothetical protein